jgi:hypothetical protein
MFARADREMVEAVRVCRGVIRLHATAILVLVAAPFLLISSPASADPPLCPGFFGVRAMVLRIEPPGATPRKQRVDGGGTPIKVDDLLCVGESLILPEGGAVQKVVLYSAGRAITITPGHPYLASGGMSAYALKALAFLSSVVDGVENLTPPAEEATGTHSRQIPSEAHPLASIASLHGLPPQRLVAGTNPVVGWRGGVAPFACRAVNDTGTAVGSAQAGAAHRCTFSAGVAGASRLIAVDSASGVEGWRLGDRAAWPEVPRPPWIPSALGAKNLTSADATAWALWVWMTAGTQWRLQALSMLDGLADAEWMAGYLRDAILAEDPRVSPR